MVHDIVSMSIDDVLSADVVAAQNHARRRRWKSLDRWFEKASKKVGRSLNAAKLRMRRTHIMCMRRQRCGVMGDSKGGTRRPKLASSNSSSSSSSSSVIWW
jgi:hypothetical protein